ncbi:preprotein translocase subunit SecG [Pelistega suis]|uniref:preprotein translocase subunit SecG n=1 Tax=Pelistega suis TaxID=1631957 RepID=UPI00211BBC45|nr:preprotein translocase subunit SecG [Pelistega suis]MCQ9328951.1 preprotein translocase subunit SecG [Pelistega suis]
MSAYLFPLLIALQVISALTIIGLVLLQQGKGADMGSSFGGGSAGSLFGSAGSANFFSRMTKWAAIVFFACTLGLAFVGADAYRQAAPTESGSVMEGFAPVPTAPETAPTTGTVPAADASVPSAPVAAPTAPAAEPAPAAGATPTAPAAETKPAAQ